jgi:predicted XRE-type DNA-binding protein
MNVGRTQTRADIEESSGNVYMDLGAHDDAAAMLVKARLAHEISKTFATRGLTQLQAASVLGVSKSKLSEMLRGTFRGVGQSGDSTPDLTPLP